MTISVFQLVCLGHWQLMPVFMCLALNFHFMICFLSVSSVFFPFCLFSTPCFLLNYRNNFVFYFNLSIVLSDISLCILIWQYTYLSLNTLLKISISSFHVECRNFSSYEALYPLYFIMLLAYVLQIFTLNTLSETVIISVLNEQAFQIMQEEKYSL